MGSYVASAVVFFLLSAAAAMAIHFYYVKRSHQRIPAVTHVMIVVSVFVCILPFPLLVIDIDAAVTGANPLVSEPWLMPMWYTIMGVTQVMAWLLLPVAQAYDDCGEFTFKRRLNRAIRENVKMYVVMGIVVGLLFAYIVFLKGLHTFTDIVQLGVAAANAFGLLLIIIFLASGLVGIPKLLWKSADPQLELRRHFYNAPDIQEDLDIAAMDLAEIKAELVAVDPRVSDEDRPFLTMMLELISATDREVPLYHTRSSQLTMEKAVEGTDVSTAHLEELHGRLKRSVKVATRMNYLWESTVRQCKELDRIVHGAAAAGASGIGGPPLSAVTRLWITIRNPLYRVLAVCAFFLTVFVLWSELVLPFQAKSSQILSVVELLIESPLHFVGSVVFLFYMATCSYWATFQFKIFEVYHVMPSVSDAASLCFTATFLTRLIMPLCYNFLMIAGLVDRDAKVVYSSVFGSMDVGSILGQWFNQYLPVFIPILATLIQTKVFHRLVRMIGIDWHDPSDMHSETVQQKIHDGRRMIMTAAGRELMAVVTTPSAGMPHSPALATTPNPSGPSSNADEKGRRYKEYLARKAAAQQTAGGTDGPS